MDLSQHNKGNKSLIDHDLLSLSMSDTKTSASPSLGYESTSYNFLSLFKSSGLSVPPFSGAPVHYDSWKSRMEVVLSSLGLMDFVKVTDEAVVKALPDFAIQKRVIHTAHDLRMTRF